jgi:hypothetical protein
MKLKNSHYPTNRDVILKSAERWMSAKKKDDNVGKNLWRVHDKLYDLTDFAKRVRQYFNIGTAQWNFFSLIVKQVILQHPGGKFWIEETEGTDVTEAFESAHADGVERILEKYFVREASTPRQSKFTFNENGFYKTLKRKVKPILKEGTSIPSFKAFQWYPSNEEFSR